MAGSQLTLGITAGLARGLRPFEPRQRLPRGCYAPLRTNPAGTRPSPSVPPTRGYSPAFNSVDKRWGVPLSGAGPLYRTPNRGGRCCGSSTGRSLLIYPSGKGGIVPDWLVVTLYAIAIALIAFGLARALDPYASSALRWIASRFTWRGGIALRAGRGRDDRQCAASALARPRLQPSSWT